MRSGTPHDLAGHCPRCFLRGAACVCSAVPRLAPRTEVIIVRHVTEIWRTSNTARLAALALDGCRIVEHGLPTPLSAAELILPGTWLLFPSGAPLPAGPPPRRLLVLDGSWSQARRMVARLPGVHALPTLTLSALPEVRRLRQPPRGGVSTLEAIGHALALLEGPAVGGPLLALHDELVRRAEGVRGRRFGRRGAAGPSTDTAPARGRAAALPRDPPGRLPTRPDTGD